MSLTLHTQAGTFYLAERYTPADLVSEFGRLREAVPLSFDLANGNALLLYWREGCDWGIEFSPEEVGDDQVQAALRHWSDAG